VVLLGPDLLDWPGRVCGCMSLGSEASGLEADRQEKHSTDNGAFISCSYACCSSLLPSVQRVAEGILRVCV